MNIKPNSAPEGTPITKGSRDLDLADTAEPAAEALPRLASNLNPLFLFENFVAGKSNQIAFAACQQVAEKPGLGGFGEADVAGGNIDPGECQLWGGTATDAGKGHQVIGFEGREELVLRDRAGLSGAVRPTRGPHEALLGLCHRP